MIFIGTIYNIEYRYHRRSFNLMDCDVWNKISASVPQLMYILYLSSVQPLIWIFILQSTYHCSSSLDSLHYSLNPCYDFQWILNKWEQFYSKFSQMVNLIPSGPLKLENGRVQVKTNVVKLQLLELEYQITSSLKGPGSSVLTNFNLLCSGVCNLISIISMSSRGNPLSRGNLCNIHI